MKTLTFKMLDSGRIPDGIKHTLSVLFPAYAGKVLRLSIEEVKKRRSNKQNRFWYGVMIPAIRAWFLEHGYNFDAQEVHEYMVRRVWKHTEVVFIENEPYERRLSSTELTPHEWEVRLEITRAWGAERGLILPFPREDDLYEELADESAE